MSFIADKNNAQVLQLSNDAFYYLYYEEEPLDENNLDEAEEVMAQFPNGFYIEDNWEAIEGTDLIEATFIPFTKAAEPDYDEYLDITRYVQVRIKWIEKDRKLKAWFANSLTEETTQLGECFVYTDNYKHLCFHTGNQAEEFTAGKMSLFFLKEFKARS